MVSCNNVDAPFGFFHLNPGSISSALLSCKRSFMVTLVTSFKRLDWAYECWAHGVSFGRKKKVFQLMNLCRWLHPTKRPLGSHW